MAIKTFDPVSSLSQFLHCVQKVRAEWGVDKGAKTKGEETQLWYRGQDRANWGLIPKIYRHEFLEADEDEIYFEFDSRGRQLHAGGLPEEKWEKYFLMQHYGAPTRLLDWTDNPLVGLFFAVDRFEKAGPAPQSARQEDAAVWILDPSWLNKQLRKKGIWGPLLAGWKEAEAYLPDPFSEKAVRVRLPAAIDPPHVDRRLAIQASRFVIFGLTKDLTKIRGVRRRNCRLAKVPVSGTSFEKIKDELEICGITWAQLFPDLAGLCKDIRRRWRTRSPSSK